jgi:hypothetical protein
VALELLLIFVALPLLLVFPVIWFVSWRTKDQAPPVLISDVLATGETAQAEITAVKNFGGFLQTRPMVRFSLRIQGADGPFELDVTQSVPRTRLRDLHRGATVAVRVTPDHGAAALVL